MLNLYDVHSADLVEAGAVVDSATYACTEQNLKIRLAWNNTHYYNKMAVWLLYDSSMIIAKKRAYSTYNTLAKIQWMYETKIMGVCDFSLISAQRKEAEDRTEVVCTKQFKFEIAKYSLNCSP